MSKIIVVGSSNVDMVVKTDHFPRPGETVLGGDFFKNPGGKGANQAVAVARLGGKTTFVTKIGNDDMGQELYKLYQSEGIDSRFIFVEDKASTGVALITVDMHGENSIVVASGANKLLTVEDVKKVEPKIENTDLILVQLEIPLEVVEYVCLVAKQKGCKVILNPAPAQILHRAIMDNLYMITPNAKEAEFLSGVPVTGWESARKASLIIAENGVKNIIITLGQLGALVYENETFTEVPAFKVKAVDTTAAGDVFNGAICVALEQNKSIVEAVNFACKASSIAVSRLGALSSIPYINEIPSFNISHNS